MPIRLRVRGPQGVANIQLPDTATVADLKSEISSKTELPMFDLKSGFPPKTLELDQFDDELKLVETGLALNGEQLIATAHDIAGPLKHSLNAETHLPPSKDLPSGTSQSKSSKAPAAPLSLQRKPNDMADEPPEVPFPLLEGTLVLRVMPDDNSCMFRAVSTAYFGGEDTMHELRSMVANTIQNDRTTYNEVTLEKKPDDYCRWITSEDSWGGYLELNILSQQLGIEICSIDVQTLRVDHYNEQAERRAIVVYSGIHYDVIALSPSFEPYTHATSPPEEDVKIFELAKDEVLQGAVQLCTILQKRHYFTDTAKFSIKCNQCGWTGNGERSATKHAESTGHMDFAEGGR